MLHDELAFAADLARKSGEIALEVYDADHGVQLKGAADPVTIADTRINAYVVEALRARFPGDGIVAEESADHGDALTAERCWFVDPLDGTKEFIAKNGEFAIMLGLAIGGRAQLGVVYQPVTDTLYRGVVGAGASLERGVGEQRVGQRLARRDQHTRHVRHGLEDARQRVDRRRHFVERVDHEHALLAERTERNVRGPPQDHPAFALEACRQRVQQRRLADPLGADEVKQSNVRMRQQRAAFREKRVASEQLRVASRVEPARQAGSRQRGRRELRDSFPGHAATLPKAGVICNERPGTIRAKLASP